MYYSILISLHLMGTEMVRVASLKNCKFAALQSTWFLIPSSCCYQLINLLRQIQLSEPSGRPLLACGSLDKTQD